MIVLVDCCWWPLFLLAPDPVWATVLTHITLRMMISQNLKGGWDPGGGPGHRWWSSTQPLRMQESTASSLQPADLCRKLQRAGRHPAWCGHPPYLEGSRYHLQPLKQSTKRPRLCHLTQVVTSCPCHPEPAPWMPPSCSRSLQSVDQC